MANELEILIKLDQQGDKASDGRWKRGGNNHSLISEGMTVPRGYMTDYSYIIESSHSQPQNVEFCAQAANARPALKWAIDTIRDLQNQIKGMSPVSNRDWIASDIAKLKNLIKGHPEASLARWSYEDRLKSQETMLAELDKEEKENPKVDSHEIERIRRNITE